MCELLVQLLKNLAADERRFNATVFENQLQSGYPLK